LQYRNCADSAHGEKETGVYRELKKINTTKKIPRVPFGIFFVGEVAFFVLK